VTDYEIGAHTQWSAGDWRGRVNLAVFTGNYDNLQLQATGISGNYAPPRMAGVRLRYTFGH
jgi:hypothetical protein